MEGGQACRHMAGRAPLTPVGPFTCDSGRLFNPLLDGGMEIERLHAAVQVAPWHTLMGAVRRSRRGEAFKTPSGDFCLVIWGTLCTSYHATGSARSVYPTRRLHLIVSV